MDGLSSHPIQFQLIKIFALYYLACCLFLVVVYRFENIIWIYLSPKMKIRANKLCMYYILSQKFSHNKSSDSSKMASTIKEIVSSLPKMIQALYQGVFSGILSLVVATVTVWKVNFTFGVGLLVWIVIYVLGSIFILKRSKNNAEQTLKVNSKIISKTAEILTNIECVKLYTNENHEKFQLRKLLQDLLIIDKEKEKFKLKIFGFQGLSFVIYQAISLFWLIEGVEQEKVNVGDIALILTINFTFVDYFRKVSKELVEFSDHLGTILEGFHTLFKENSIKEEVITFKPRYLQAKGKISLRNVHFQYERGVSIFENVDLDIQMGERIVIVGASGSGKSTLVDLLTRLRKPTGGKIYFDGIDSQEFSINSLRASIGVVHQNPGIFSGSIRENILYGNLKASTEEMIWASKNAHIHTFIQTLPEGYQTHLDVAKLNLSKGQCQRIALARALIKNPEILILDEPTSNIDSETTEEIEKNLIQITESKTSLFITHNLSHLLASAADRILIVQKGKIEEYHVSFSS